MKPTPELRFVERKVSVPLTDQELVAARSKTP